MNQVGNSAYTYMYKHIEQVAVNERFPRRGVGLEISRNTRSFCLRRTNDDREDGN